MRRAESRIAVQSGFVDNVLMALERVAFATALLGVQDAAAGLSHMLPGWQVR